MSTSLRAFLPTTGDDALLDDLSAADLVRFQRVSGQAREMVVSYLRRHFKITNVVKPFICEVFIDDFRKLMAETNLLISGSVPVQLFARTTWDNCDLDLYVDELHAATVAHWLLAHGLAFVPRHEADSFDALVNVSYTHCGTDYLSLSPTTILAYLGENKVINFKNVESGRKVQLVKCKGTPLQSVLNFHSTVVMNIITHEKAYCIFPKATLEEKNGVRRHFSGMEHLPAALEKYRNRGYDIVERLTTEGAFGCTAVVPFGRRTLTDSMCWSIPWERSLDIPKSTIGINSWAITYEPDMSMRISAFLCRARRLRFSYVFDGCTSEKELQRKWSELQLLHPGNSFLDHEFGDMIVG